jgi:hypothetical protein
MHDSVCTTGTDTGALDDADAYTLTWVYDFGDDINAQVSSSATIPFTGVEVDTTWTATHNTVLHSTATKGAAVLKLTASNDDTEAAVIACQGRYSILVE